LDICARFNIHPLIDFSAKNPRLRQYPNRYGQAEKKKKEVRKKVYFCGNEKLL
jgi:hypothetical protein